MQLSRTSKINAKNIFKTKKYILIREAPPWTEQGLPRYFYHEIKVVFIKKFGKRFIQMIR